MIRAHVSVGIGAWSFSMDLLLTTLPREGEGFALDGDGPSTVVTSVSHTPTQVYLRCHERYATEAAWREDEQAWREAAASNNVPVRFY